VADVAKLISEALDLDVVVVDREVDLPNIVEPQLEVNRGVVACC
jgi:hypothetical protein